MNRLEKNRGLFAYPAALAVFVLVTSLSTAAVAQIRGHIGGVLGDSARGFRLVGWACDVGVSQSIRVRVFTGGTSKSGEYLLNAVANGNNDVGVNTFCKSKPGTPHRFSIPLPNELVGERSNMPIYVHGTSVTGGKNLIIARSGEVFMPEIGIVKGHIQNVRDLGSSVQISGWACQVGVEEGIGVRLFAGGPSGSGTYIKTGTLANLTKPIGVAQACGTKSSAHGFVMNISPAEYESYLGKSIYIHGIRKYGRVPNSTLSDSGKFAFPRGLVTSEGTARIFSTTQDGKPWGYIKIYPDASNNLVFERLGPTVEVLYKGRVLGEDLQPALFSPKTNRITVGSTIYLRHKGVPLTVTRIVEEGPRTRIFFMEGQRFGSWIFDERDSFDLLAADGVPRIFTSTTDDGSKSWGHIKLYRDSSNNLVFDRLGATAETLYGGLIRGENLRPIPLNSEANRVYVGSTIYLRHDGVPLTVQKIVTDGSHKMIIFSKGQRFASWELGDDMTRLLLQEVYTLDAKAKLRRLSDKAKRLVEAAKRTVDNLIAARLRLQTCAQLNSADTTLKTGVYTLYPDGKLDSGVLVECNVSGGKATTNVIHKFERNSCVETGKCRLGTSNNSPAE